MSFKFLNLKKKQFYIFLSEFSKKLHNNHGVTQSYKPGLSKLSGATDAHQQQVKDSNGHHF